MNSELNFHVDALVKNGSELSDFEGPLSLILTLLQNNKIQIRDLMISDLLDQYLAYLDTMQEMDLDIASEFVRMASHLLYIKTKMLITGEKQITELEELMASLEKLQAKNTFEAVTAAIPQLRDMLTTGSRFLCRPRSFTSAENSVENLSVKRTELLSAVYAVFSRMPKTDKLAETLGNSIPQKIIYSVKVKGRELIEKLRRGPVTLRCLFSSCADRDEVIAVFVAALELCNLGALRFAGDENDMSIELAEEIPEEYFDRISD